MQCTHIRGDRIHPLWLEQLACRLRWLATKMFMEIFPPFMRTRLGLYWWQADQGTPVQENKGCTTEFCVILSQLCHNLEILFLWISLAALGLLCYVAANVQSRYALVVSCFVGRDLGPPSYRAVVLGELGLAWNCGRQEQASKQPIVLKIVILTCEKLLLIE